MSLEKAKSKKNHYATLFLLVQHLRWTNYGETEIAKRGVEFVTIFRSLAPGFMGMGQGSGRIHKGHDFVEHLGAPV